MGVIKDIYDKGVAAGLVQMQLNQKAARTWFINEAKKIGHIDRPDKVVAYPKKALHPKEVSSDGPIAPGYMVIFRYDAKTKEKLEYWDKYPCVFPIDLKGTDGFLGINLHYLPLDLRVKLMDALYTMAFNNQYSDEMRLRISYEILSSSTKFKAFRPCIKHYLYAYMRSDFHKIPFEEWNIAAYLPLARFQKASEATVHADSRKKIANYQPKRKK